MIGDQTEDAQPHGVAARFPARSTGGSLPPAEWALLTVAVVGISLAAPLAAVAAAPAPAIAFWRNAVAGVILLPRVLARRGGGRARRRPGRADLQYCVLAGMFLAAHFGMWIPSLTMTSIATSTALMCTTPLWAGLIARARGRSVPKAGWAGMLVAFLGVLVVSSVDIGMSAEALAGDALALASGVCLAAYLSVGEHVRQRLDTETYTLICYATAAAALVTVCLLTGSALVGYSAGTWMTLAALTFAGQLLGHSLLNRSLGVVSGATVAVVSLLEVPGAALLAALWLGQAPPLEAYVGVLVILAGVFVVVRADASGT
ncbi:EamA family transporter [Streptomyces sp. SA15]|uniref:DMT family transporter n=1 Tax=Streptomyces sp. SA15 TaxID=934019 RepID=UPI000BB04E19|nr:DMT family transporter [Streptomyces sp. SA15]PAZ15746.1 EamA family transporter [Streptomyces sp. SA15]